MCNLYSSTMPPDAMRHLFDVKPEQSHLGNLPALPAIYQKYEAPIVTVDHGERSLIRAQWGFLTPKKSKDGTRYIKPTAWNNARDDKIRIIPLWRDSFEHRRCLVPATAYAESTGKAPATFHWFNVAGVEGFAFAGIWKHQRGRVGDEEVDTIVHSVVTTEPNEMAARYHNRMPVILPVESYEAWLTGPADEAFALVEPFPADQMQLIGEGIGMKEEPA